MNQINLMDNIKLKKENDMLRNQIILLGQKTLQTNKLLEDTRKNMRQLRPMSQSPYKYQSDKNLNQYMEQPPQKAISQINRFKNEFHAEPSQKQFKRIFQQQNVNVNQLKEDQKQLIIELEQERNLQQNMESIEQKYQKRGIMIDKLNQKYCILKEDYQRQKNEYELILYQKNKKIEEQEDYIQNYINQGVLIQNDKNPDQKYLEFEQLYNEAITRKNIAQDQVTDLLQRIKIFELNTGSSNQIDYKTELNQLKLLNQNLKAKLKEQQSYIDALKQSPKDAQKQNEIDANIQTVEQDQTSLEKNQNLNDKISFNNQKQNTLNTEEQKSLMVKSSDNEAQKLIDDQLQLLQIQLKELHQENEQLNINNQNLIKKISQMDVDKQQLSLQIEELKIMNEQLLIDIKHKDETISTLIQEQSLLIQKVQIFEKEIQDKNILIMKNIELNDTLFQKFQCIKTEFIQYQIKIMVEQDLLLIYKEKIQTFQDFKFYVESFKNQQFHGQLQEYFTEMVLDRRNDLQISQNFHTILLMLNQMIADQNYQYSLQCLLVTIELLLNEKVILLLYLLITTLFNVLHYQLILG